MSTEYFAYVEGAIRFTYYPHLNKVACTNGLSFYRSIEHFAYRGFEIDWTKSNINTLNLFVKAPEFLTEEETFDILSKGSETLYHQSKADEAKTRGKLILNNIDNNTGLPIEEVKLRNKIANMQASKHNRYICAEWIGHYNIEVARPDKPLVTVSTKSKAIIMKEGKRVLLGLFEKGLLRKLTEEEYQEKLDKHSKGEHYQGEETS